MKKFALILLATLLLALNACGRTDQDVPSPDESPYSQEALSADGVGLSMEWPVVDASVTRLTCLVANETDQELSFGSDYGLERLDGDGVWRTLHWKEDHAFDSVARILAPGDSMALTISLDAFDFAFGDGTYRVVKTFESGAAEARFRIGRSAVTAETPYGFVPLEDLPADYGEKAAAADGCVVCGVSGTRNVDAVDTFLTKVGLGVPCQLRLLCYTTEGDPILSDVVYENGSLLWRWDDSRDGFAGADRGVHQERFSYLVTDGAAVCLSNAADWDTAQGYAGEDPVYLLPEGMLADETAQASAVAAVEEMTRERLAANSARYRVWSGDGGRCAFLTEEPLTFGWDLGGSGTTDRLDLEGASALLGLGWSEGDELELVCAFDDGNVYAVTYDPALASVTGGPSLLYGMSAPEA